jgi:hypothetical protein
MAGQRRAAQQRHESAAQPVVAARFIGEHLGGEEAVVRRRRGERGRRGFLIEDGDELRRHGAVVVGDVRGDEIGFHEDGPPEPAAHRQREGGLCRVVAGYRSAFGRRRVQVRRLVLERDGSGHAGRNFPGPFPGRGAAAGGLYVGDPRGGRARVGGDEGILDERAGDGPAAVARQSRPKPSLFPGVKRPALSAAPTAGSQCLASP